MLSLKTHSELGPNVWRGLQARGGGEDGDDGGNGRSGSRGSGVEDRKN